METYNSAKLELKMELTLEYADTGILFANDQGLAYCFVMQLVTLLL